MNDICILDDVVNDLEHQDYEQAMIDIAELEGGVYDQIKTLISFQEYERARRLAIKVIINTLNELELED